jgi:hypothetical protein
MKSLPVFLLLVATQLYAQPWMKIDSVFNPFGVSVQSFSAPEFCDIDADGDFDLFVDSLSDDRVAFFRNTGTVTVPVFRKDTSLLSSVYKYGTQFTNATYSALVDIDGDNDFDLVIGGFNGLLLYRNVGDSLLPQWEQDTTLFKTINLSLGTDDKPTFADIDNDGDFDLIVGIGESFYGNTTAGITIAFRNTGTKFSPKFEADNSIVAGIPDVGLNAYPTLKDMDNDGDVDMIMGRDLQTMLYYKNTGTAQAPVWTSTPALVSGIESTTYWKNPTVCDLDGDGKNDLIYGTSDGSFRFYKNIGTPTAPQLQSSTAFFQGIRIDGSASTTSLADFDYDGDYDLLSGDWLGRLQYFRNDGNSAHPNFIKTTAAFTSLKVSSYSSPRFVDINGDGYIDIVTGQLAGTVSCYINTNGTFAQNTTMFTGIDVGWSSAPTFADLNNDGNLDMLVCGEESGLSTFYKNTGNNTFVADNSLIAGVTIPNYAFPCFVDLDNDGDIDLVFGRIGGDIVYYENIGTPSVPAWKNNSDVFKGIEVSQSSTPAFVDLDGDGKKDMIIGEYSGNFSFYKNLMPTSVQKNTSVIPERFVLEQNYPNPFNPSTTVRYGVPERCRVRLSIYNTLGQQLSQLVNATKDAGNYESSFNASQLPSGIYYYRIEVISERSSGKTFVDTKKMVLLR